MPTPVNDFKPFSTGPDNDVVSQSEYASATWRIDGWLSGILPHQQINKVLRQSSSISAAVAQTVADLTNSDVIDSGDLTALTNLIKTAFSAFLPYNPATTYPTGSIGWAIQSGIGSSVPTAEAIRAVLTGQLTAAEFSSIINGRLNLIDAPITGLVTKVADLTTAFGSTTAAATSAANAAASAIAAVAAQNAAAVSAGAALTSETNSNASKIAAATSASSASSSATGAATSASSAAGSASSANTSATNAAASASAAGTSATAATTKASEAATSATNAATYASASDTARVAAQTAAGSASASSSSAASSATSAAGSASTATTKASQAASAEAAAAGSAVAANNSATTASAQATTATTQAGIATTAANTATTKANDASSSATAAASSATTANSASSTAGSFASAANASAVSASASQGAAATSASNAAASASAASTSASSASASASAAGTSASAANTAKLAAETAQAAASSSQTAAANSATTASGAASSASSSATVASTAQSNAAGSATAANTSASQASTSATNAANSATAAADWYNSTVAATGSLTAQVTAEANTRASQIAGVHAQYVLKTVATRSDGSKVFGAIALASSAPNDATGGQSNIILQADRLTFVPSSDPNASPTNVLEISTFNGVTRLRVPSALIGEITADKFQLTTGTVASTTAGGLAMVASGGAGFGGAYSRFLNPSSTGYTYSGSGAPVPGFLLGTVTVPYAGQTIVANITGTLSIFLGSNWSGQGPGQHNLIINNRLSILKVVSGSVVDSSLLTLNADQADQGLRHFDVSGVKRLPVAMTRGFANIPAGTYIVVFTSDVRTLQESTANPFYCMSGCDISYAHHTFANSV